MEKDGQKLKKLTLTIPQDVIDASKRIAFESGVSISQKVADFLRREADAAKAAK